MSPHRAQQPVTYRRVCRSGIGNAISSIELDPHHVERFLGPLDDIVAAVRRGPATAMFTAGDQDQTIGFYVLHPDRRDGACWWLGWFALDRRVQGRGLGRTIMANIMATYRRIVGCRRVRLLVARDNPGALRLYAQAGFRQVGVTARTGELILEAALSGSVATGGLRAALIRRCSTPGHLCRQGRLRLSPGPYAARVIGVERAPPAMAMRPA